VRCRACRRGEAITDLPELTFNYPQQPFDETCSPPMRKRLLPNCASFANRARQLRRARDFPAIEGTSRLSACLALGVSLRASVCIVCWRSSRRRWTAGGSVWLNELIWREFYRHLMTYHPDLCKHRPFIRWTDNVKWQSNDKQLKAWQNGQTGYPIVDAAMRQLNETGWMHNRLRMITASFLVKDLLIDWRIGERYFISQLIDGDLAANNGGWQWAASTGTDAAPYFRIFNPTTQGQKFDADGEFIRRWLPELNGYLRKRSTTRGHGRINRA
jgi:deoxyribodipyrimidine photo-lyase